MTEDMRIVFDPLRAGHEMLFIEDHRGDATNTANDPVVLGFPNVICVALIAEHLHRFEEDHRLVAVHRCGGIEMDIGLGHRRAQKFCLLLTNICYRGGDE